MGSNQEVFASGPHRAKITSIICPLVPWKSKPAPHRSKSNGCDQIQKTKFVDHFYALELIFRRGQRQQYVIWCLQTSRSWSVMWQHSTLFSHSCGTRLSVGHLPPLHHVPPSPLSISSPRKSRQKETPACCCCFARAAGLSHFSSDFSGFNPKTPPAQN